MDEKILKEINANLEEIWHRLEGIQHYLQEISMNGVLGRDTEESILAIARAVNKDFDKELKELEDSPGAEV